MMMVEMFFINDELEFERIWKENGVIIKAEFFQHNYGKSSRNLQRKMQLIHMIGEELLIKLEKELMSCKSCVELEYFVREHCKIDPCKGIKYDENNNKTINQIYARPKIIKFPELLKNKKESKELKKK